MSIKKCIIVAYSESCDVKKVIDEMYKKGNLISYAYILHNLDLLENGTFKKEHYHIYLNFQNPTTKEQVARKFNIDKSLVQSCLNPNGIIRYFLHLDDKEKVQYKREAIYSLGLDIDHMITQGTLGTASELDILMEILSWVNKGFTKKEVFELCIKFNYYAVYRANYSIIRDLYTANNL